MNNHSKEKFRSQHWTFCNNHGKHSSRAPLQLQILHRSITNVLQNTLKIKLHCQVIEFCASGMLLALHFFLINVKHPVILKRFSHHFLNLPTPLEGIVSNTKIFPLPPSPIVNIVFVIPVGVITWITVPAANISWENPSGSKVHNGEMMRKVKNHLTPEGQNPD